MEGNDDAADNNNRMRQGGCDGWSNGLKRSGRSNHWGTSATGRPPRRWAERKRATSKRCQKAEVFLAPVPVWLNSGCDISRCVLLSWSPACCTRQGAGSPRAGGGGRDARADGCSRSMVAVGRCGDRGASGEPSGVLVGCNTCNGAMGRGVGDHAPSVQSTSPVTPLPGSGCPALLHLRKESNLA